MSSKLIGWIGIIAVALLVILSLGADLIGIGTYPGIHTAQLVGLGGGLVMLILGIFAAREKQKSKER